MILAKLNRLRLALIVATLIVFVFLYLCQENKIAGSSGFPIDDAWIHCQFARNIARGYGMSYNPGIPMSGSTAPLWTLLLAASYFISSNLVFTSKLLGITLHAFTCILVFRIIFFILEDDRFAFLGAILAAMISALTWGSLSGMEMMMSAFLTLAGVYLYLIYRMESGPKRYASTILFALASLARPESLLLVFIALLDSFLLGRLEKNEKVLEFAKQAFIHLLLFFMFLSPYFIFNYSVSGGIFPATLAAKKSGGIMAALSGGGLQELEKSLSFYPKVYMSRVLQIYSQQNLLLYWLMYVGAGRLVVDAFRKKVKNKALIIPLILILYPICMAILTPAKMVAEWMFRYIANLIVLHVITAVVGLHGVTLFFRSTLSEFWVGRETARKITRATLATVVIVLLFSLSIEEYKNSTFYARGVENINSMHVRIGRWMKKNSSPDAVLAVNDIGAIAYFSERRIIDLVGLVTPEALPYRKKPGGAFEFITLKKPDYVIIYPKWFPDMRRHKELVLLFEVSLEKNVVCGDSTKVVYKTAWSD